jgi:ferredoxin-NADP reductase
MTGIELLGYISAALLIQIVAGILIAAFRYQRAHASSVDRQAVPSGPSTAAWDGLRAFRVRSRENEDRAGNQTSFYLEPVDGEPLAPYQAGQFLTFQLDLPDGPGTVRTVTRCYSLSDRHDPSAYRITVKRSAAPPGRPDLPPGLVSTYFHDRVAPGTVLQLRAPAGVFVLDKDLAAPVVLIAGGIGITPLFAMARAALIEQSDRNIHLFYGVRDSRERVFERDLTGMAADNRNFHMIVVQSDPLSGDGERDHADPTGFIDVDFLRRVLPAGTHHFYVCGPPAMMASLVPALREWGVAADALHYEAFGPASIGATEALVPEMLPTPLAVKFALSARTLDWTGEESNLLDFAERHGIDLPSGCRSGSCGTCETEIEAGTVRYANAPAFDIAPGRCLPCVCSPTGDLVLGA